MRHEYASPQASGAWWTDGLLCIRSGCGNNMPRARDEDARVDKYNQIVGLLYLYTLGDVRVISTILTSAHCGIASYIVELRDRAEPNLAYSVTIRVIYCCTVCV